MRASEVIQALRESGALHTPDNTNIEDVRDDLAALTAEWSRPPEMPVLGTDGLQQALTRVVERLAVGVRGAPLHDVLVDAGGSVPTTPERSKWTGIRGRRGSTPHMRSPTPLCPLWSHEVGHHVRGHTGEANLARLHAVASGEAISEFSTSVQMELEADVLGCELLLMEAAEAGGDLNRFVNAAIGIEHLWCTLELLERASPRPVSDETHPPIMLRRHFVDSVYAAKEGFEPVRHAVAGYRRLHHDLWRTLAKPSLHDIACWKAEREKARSRVRDAVTAMARFAQQERRAEFDTASSELRRVHSESSKLFFESAVADLAILEGLSSATRMPWETLCDLPQLMLLMLDHEAPFLGQRVDGPDIPFAEIFVPD
jgi:hypothetical protein